MRSESLYNTVFIYYFESALKQIELRFAHFQPPTNYASTRYLAPWAKKVEEATGGKVKVTVYAGGTLAKETETLTAVQFGVADIGLLVDAYAKGSFPLGEVNSLPFIGLLSGKQDGKTLSPGLVNSLISWELYEKVPELQAEHANLKVKCLFVHTTIPASLVTAKKPVRNLKDLQGLKVRTLPGSQTETMKALGAAPSTLPIPEVYEAAQRGVLDGMVANPAQILNYRFWDVFPYETAVNLGIGNRFSMIMNLEKWNSLPPDVQKGIMSVSGRYGAAFAGEEGYGFGALQEVTEAMTKAGRTMTSINLDPGEEQKWIDVGGKPIWDKWVAEMKAKGLPGQKVLDELLQIQAKYK
ncbi:MAG: TRAP transporter substrate-binding protein [Dehalococcoidia bacterium]|nr:TRAP transporter substrate-binding protein [Dehalococcoidia bacterium]